MTHNALNSNSFPDSSALDQPVRPLRVLVTGYRSHPHVGGQGVYIRNLTRALADLGHEVTVVSGPPYPELDPDIGLDTLPSLDLFAETNAFLALRPRHLGSWADMAEWLSHNTGAFGELYAFGVRLEAYIARHHGRFDVIHDNQTLASPFVRIDRTLPVITTLHHPIEIDRRFALEAGQSLKDRLFTRRWYRFVKMQARTSRALSRHLAVSAAARDTHAELYGTRPETMRVAFNGLDHQVFYADHRVARRPGLIATTASADAPIKGLDVLIKAFAETARTHDTARLLIIGQLRDGPAKRALQSLGLENRVETRSNLTREDIATLYREASIVACPARFEGFGFPAAEAMACGAAVAASDGGALPEVVGETGLVSPAGDAPALAANLNRLLQDDDLRRQLGEAAIARARSAFHWSSHARTASRLYVEALAERGIH